MNMGNSRVVLAAEDGLLLARYDGRWEDSEDRGACKLQSGHFSAVASVLFGHWGKLACPLPIPATKP
jgi:hypothetical protein